MYVRNEGDGFWSAEDAWVLERSLQIGSLDESAEAHFSSQLLSTVHGENGHILVLDYLSGHVLEFDGAGRLIGQFGRRGEGPGEFSAPTGVALDEEGRVWVADAGSSRYTALGEDSEVEGIYPRPVRATLARQQQLFLGSDGTILDLASRGATHGDVVFIRTHPEAGASDTVLSVAMPDRITGPSSRGPSGPAMNRVGLHYLEGLVWTLAPDGSFWVATTGGARLVNLSPAGDTIRVIEVSHRPRPLTDDDEALVAAALREAGLSRGDLHVVPSVVKFLRVTEDRHLLVFLAEDPIDVEASINTASVMEVYDPEGRFLGAVDLGFAIPRVGVPSIRGDTLVTPIVGELDAIFVLKAVLRRP